MSNNWKTYILGEISDIFDSLHQTPKYSEQGISMVRVTDIKEGYLNIEKTFKVSEEIYEVFSKKHKPNFGDIVMSRVGSYGISSFVNFNSKFCIGQNTLIISPKIESKFLYYSLISNSVKEQIEACVTGSTQKTISLKDIKLLSIKCPSRSEQKAIASILSALDDKIELNLQMNKTLEEMAMALYKHWFVDFGPFKDGKFVESELGMIPEGWEVKNFLDLFDLLSGGTPKTSVDEYWNGDIEWVSAKDIGNNGSIYINNTEKKITQLGVSKSATKLLPEDTIVIVARGSVGKYGMIAKPMTMNQSCYGVYSKSNYPQSITYLVIGSLIQHFLNVAYGSVFDTITTSTFQNIKILLPPNKIMEEIKEQIEPLFKKIKQNINENSILVNKRDTLLPKLISGEVRVKDLEKIDLSQKTQN